jgi:hypothetical protein
VETDVRCMSVKLKTISMEREKGFEPSTLALARRCSTTELFPLARFEVRSVLTYQGTVKPRPCWIHRKL